VLNCCRERELLGAVNPDHASLLLMFDLSRRRRLSLGVCFAFVATHREQARGQADSCDYGRTSKLSFHWIPPFQLIE
jgi:hypothetical protein